MDEDNQPTGKDWMNTLLSFIFVGIGGALGVAVADFLGVGPPLQIVVYTVVITATLWIGVDLLPRLV